MCVQCIGGTKSDGRSRKVEQTFQREIWPSYIKGKKNTKNFLPEKELNELRSIRKASKSPVEGGRKFIIIAACLTEFVSSFFAFEAFLIIKRRTPPGHTHKPRRM